MNPLTFFSVAFFSTVLALTGLISYYICPAWKRAKIAEALVVLSKCMKSLDQEALTNENIKKGRYLHDNFYKLISSILVYKINLNPAIINRSKSDKDIENTRCFREEVECLDEKTRNIVKKAALHIQVILFLRNPLTMTILFFQTWWAYRKEGVKPDTAEMLTVQTNQNYTLLSCRI